MKCKYALIGYIIFWAVVLAAYINTEVNYTYTHLQWIFEICIYLIIPSILGYFVGKKA